MQPKTPKWLEDIRMAADLILQVTSGRTLENYCGDVVLRSAVERQFEIIGEALRRVATHDPQTAARVGHTRRSSPSTTSWPTSTTRWMR